MSRTAQGIATRAVLFITFIFVLTQAHAFAQTYTWRNVQIFGGGFIVGVVFNQTEANLVYTRTDIGGAYRLDNATGRWVSLLDSISWDDWNLTGVASIATDPVNPNNVYLAAGTYTNEWTTQNGAILRSTDRGATWQRTMLPFKLGGNMPGRGAGERLAIDPNRNSTLYLAAPSGNGLWRSTDSGVTWSKVTSFPNPGNYVQDPTDPNNYLTDNQGVYWVTFDKRTGTPGNTTQTIYVGVADLATSIYRSMDGGATWSAVPGQPSGFLPHKEVLDTAGGFLWAAVSSQPSGLTGGGSVAVSATGGGKIVWSPAGAGVFYTTGGGKTWTASTGIPAGARVASDRVNANKFYGFKSGTFYVSTDGGKTFAAKATGLALGGPVRFKAVPGREGDIWLAGGAEWDNTYGLWHSLDSGTSFTKLANVEEADNIGFGKAATGQTYMALYAPAQVAGVRGIFRSIDAGQTWVRINDDQHQWGHAGDTAITGDPRIFGRVYIGTNGRGIIYGDSQ